MLDGVLLAIPLGHLYTKKLMGGVVRTAGALMFVIMGLPSCLFAFAPLARSTL